ncbi:MAG: hypothetical protein ABWY54_04220 [Glaciihabitans sp.]
MALTRTKGLSTLAVLGVAGLILTGCSSSSGDNSSTDASSAPSPTPVVEEQSVEEACTTLIDGVTEMQSSLNENLTELQTDPAAAAEAYQGVVDLFNENAAKVTNEDVKPVADEIGAVFTEFGTTMDAAATDPASVDPQAVNDYVTNLQAATTKLDELCAA